MSDYLPCDTRQKMSYVGKDGESKTAYRCVEKDAPAFNTDVTPETCLECPVRVAVLKEAKESGRSKRRRTERIANATREEKDSGGDGFADCNDRLVVFVPLCCGAEMPVRVCDSMNSPFYQSEVAPNDCNNCSVRKAIK